MCCFLVDMAVNRALACLLKMFFSAMSLCVSKDNEVVLGTCIAGADRWSWCDILRRTVLGALHGMQEARGSSCTCCKKHMLQTC